MNVGVSIIIASIMNFALIRSLQEPNSSRYCEKRRPFVDFNNDDNDGQAMPPEYPLG